MTGTGREVHRPYCSETPKLPLAAGSPRVSFGDCLPIRAIFANLATCDLGREPVAMGPSGRSKGFLLLRCPWRWSRMSGVALLHPSVRWTSTSAVPAAAKARPSWSGQIDGCAARQCRAAQSRRASVANCWEKVPGIRRSGCAPLHILRAALPNLARRQQHAKTATARRSGAPVLAATWGIGSGNSIRQTVGFASSFPAAEAVSACPFPGAVLRRRCRAQAGAQGRVRAPPRHRRSSPRRPPLRRSRWSPCCPRCQRAVRR